MMNVLVAASASRAGANAAEGGASAAADALSSDAQSAFQALFAPALAGNAAAVLPATTAGNPGLVPEPPVDALAADATALTDAGGKDLPVAVAVPLLPAAAVPAVVLGATAAVAADAAASAGGTRQSASTAVADEQVLTLQEGGALASTGLDRFLSGPHRLPGVGLPVPALLVPGAAGSDPLSAGMAGDLRDATPAAPIDLAEMDAALDASLERFLSAPHRLAATGIAAFGAAQLLKFADGAGRSPGALVAELARGAVDAGFSPALLPATGSAASSAAAATPAGFAQTPGSAAWGQALDQQVMLMLNRGAQEARIRLHPQELGQMDIRLSLGGDRVDLNFSVQHASVAGVLQQHLPQLTQMLADQGLSLGQASVSHEQAQSGGAAGQNGSSHDGNGAFAASADGEIETSHLLYQPAARGLLDIFA